MIVHPYLSTRRIGFGGLILVAAIVLVVPLPAVAPAPPPAPHGVPVQFTSASLRILTDGGSLGTTVGSVHSVISDSARPTTSSGTSRAYEIRLTVSQPLPAVALDLQTCPMFQWAQPNQVPGGADVLPAEVNWTWAVKVGATSDTANWSYTSSSGMLLRQIPWTNATYNVVGSVSLTVSVTVRTGTLSGQKAPNLGVVLSYGGFNGAPVASANSALLNLTKPLGAPLDRISLSGIGSTYLWNQSQGQIVVNFSRWDAAYTLAASTHSPVYMDFPVGTWGNGNNLPAGTPMNLSDPVPFESGTGYFPTVTAYTKFIGSIVAHVKQNRETVTYWNVGNEAPLVNGTIVAEYIRLFNAAGTTIHATFPRALVGSDVMTRSSTYLPVFAANAKSVGYLSFHYYAANRICVTPQLTYCPPNGTAGNPTDPQIWANSSSLAHKAFLPPFSAQSEWYNLTKHWLPIFDSETNLNAAGGPYTAGGGTDPRIPTTFNAAWTVSTLIAGAQQNVSAMTFFTLNGPAAPTGSGTWADGGWGFGLIAQNTGHAARIYAPYWALKMWSSFLPAGSAGLVTTTSNSNVVRAFAVRTSGGIGIALVNGVNTTVHVALKLVGGTHKGLSGEAVDGRSYVETYNPSNGTVFLAKSGTRSMPAALRTGTLHLTIFGYGAAFVDESRNGTARAIRAPSHMAAPIDPASGTMDHHGSATTADSNPRSSPAPHVVELNAATRRSEGRGHLSRA